MSDGRDFEQFMRSAEGIGKPSAEDTRRAFGKLSSHVAWQRALPSAVAEALHSATAPSTAAGSARPSWSRRSWAKVVGIALPVIGISVIGYSVTTTSAPVVAPRVAMSAASVAAPVVTTPPPSEASTEVPTVADPSQLPTAKVEAPSARPRSSGSDPSREGTLDAELALLAKTSAALQAHDPARALALADLHDRTFPRGVFGPEFAAQRVLALAALGKHAEACIQAAQFLAANPSSPLSSQVRSACDAAN